MSRGSHALCTWAVAGLSVTTVPLAHGQQLNQWTSTTGTVWRTNAAWSLGRIPTATDIAVFNDRPTSATNGIGINMAATANNAPGNQPVGAIWVTSSRLNDLFIGNNATTAGGYLTFNGGTVDGFANTLIYHQGGAINAPTTFRLTGQQGGGTLWMDLVFSVDGFIRTRTAGTGLTGASNGNTILLECESNNPDRHITFLGGGDGTNRGGTLACASGGIGSIFGNLTIGGANGGEAGRVSSLGGITVANTLTINPHSQFLMAATGINAGQVVLKSSGLAAANSNTVVPGGIRVDRGSGEIATSAPIQLQASSSIHVEGAGEALRLNGAITQAGGTHALTKSGAGNLIVTQACSYGDTALLGGAITIDGGNNRLPTTTNLSTATGTSLILGTSASSRGQTLASLTGTGSVVGAHSTSNSALTLSGGSSVFGGQLGGSTVAQNRLTLALTNASLELSRPSGNTYTGATSVNAGSILRLSNSSGSATGTGPLTIASGARLEGLGRSTGALTANGVIAPGTPTQRGLLTTGASTFASTSVLSLDLMSAADYDALNIVGSLNLSASPSLQLMIGFTPSMSSAQQLWIVRNDGTDAITGRFSGLAEGSAIPFPGGISGFIYYSADHATGALTGGNDVVIVVPGPATLITCCGLLALVGRRRTWARRG